MAEPAILIGSKPVDFVNWIEDRSAEKLREDLREADALIEQFSTDLTVTPIEKFQLTKDANYLIKLVTKNRTQPERLYEEAKYRFFVSNFGAEIVRCDQKPKEGWLEIIT